jgi:hypothetical protein
VDNITTTVIEEIIRLFKTLQEDHAEITLGESEFLLSLEGIQREDIIVHLRG